ncbi:MAG: hypothetical protein P1V97_29725, partial [Planctomycetota bacterium]|nr:hypothetical protein [Planctomycetota bacterium]
MDKQCKIHNEIPATRTCERCGDFVCDYCAHKFYDYQCEQCVSEILPQTRYAKRARNSGTLVGTIVSGYTTLMIGSIITLRFNLLQILGLMDGVFLIIAVCSCSYLVGGRTLARIKLSGTHFQLPTSMVALCAGPSLIAGF